jgi:hypothetical protein
MWVFLTGGAINFAAKTARDFAGRRCHGLCPLCGLAAAFMRAHACGALPPSSIQLGSELGNCACEVAFVWHRKVLLGATSLDLFAVQLGGATALLPIYARGILHAGPEGLQRFLQAPTCFTSITKMRRGHYALAAVE